MHRSNVYGFDFLKAEHTTLGSVSPVRATSSVDHLSQLQLPTSTRSVHNVANKSDLEKQYDVIQFLQAHRSSGYLPPSVIYKATGIDLSVGGHDENVTKLLIQNPKIRIEEIPDPENPSLTIQTFGYQAKYNSIRNKSGLLALVNRSKNGVKKTDLLDSYDGVEEDIASLVTAGDVLAVRNSEDKDLILFPRGDHFLVELDGHIDLPIDTKEESDNVKIEREEVSVSEGKSDGDKMQNDNSAKVHESNKECFIVNTDIDPRKQLRRGEAVWIAGQWFRVSSAVKTSTSSKEQPFRAQAPPSVTLRKDLSKKNEADGYIRPFDYNTIPLDKNLSTTAMKNLIDARAAWDLLHKIAGGRSGVAGGVSSQLLSSNASSTNPEKLAATFLSSLNPSGGNMTRRARPSNGSVSVGGGRHVQSIPGKVSSDPLEETKKAASDPALIFGFARRHGVTLDVRDMYLATRADVPESEVDLHNLMIKYKLKESDELIRRPKMKFKNSNMGEDGKPKKRRYYERKGQRFTNTHLRGTEIGAALARAAERQQGGEQVGDGGM